jgi:hypothetical protein
MTTHRTVLLTLAASIAAAGTTASTAAAASCKVNQGEVIADVQAKGSASCGAALQVADVFWQAHAMDEADKRGDLVQLTDRKTGITAETFSSRGWRCVRSVMYTDRTEDGSTTQLAEGAAKCVKGKRIVTWQIVDLSADAE